MHEPGFQEAMEQFNALFVVVCRDRMRFLPYGVKDVYLMKLYNEGRLHRTESLFEIESTALCIAATISDVSTNLF